MSETNIPEMYNATSLTKNSEIQPVPESKCWTVLNTNLKRNMIYLIGETKTVFAVVSDNATDVYSDILMVDNSILLNNLLTLRLQLVKDNESAVDIVDRFVCNDTKCMSYTEVEEAISELLSELRGKYWIMWTSSILDLSDKNMSSVFNYYTTINDFNLVLRADETLADRYADVMFKGKKLILLSYNDRLYDYIELKSDGGVPVMTISHYNQAGNGLVCEKTDNFLVDIHKFEELTDSIPYPEIIPIQEEDIHVPVQYRCCLTGLRRGSKTLETVANTLDIDRRLLM